MRFNANILLEFKNIRDIDAFIEILEEAIKDSQTLKESYHGIVHASLIPKE